MALWVAEQGFYLWCSEVTSCSVMIAIEHMRVIDSPGRISITCLTAFLVCRIRPRLHHLAYSANTLKPYIFVGRRSRV